MLNAKAEPVFLSGLSALLSSPLPAFLPGRATEEGLFEPLCWNSPQHKGEEGTETQASVCTQARGALISSVVLQWNTVFNRRLEADICRIGVHTHFFFPLRTIIWFCSRKNPCIPLPCTSGSTDPHALHWPPHSALQRQGTLGTGMETSATCNLGEKNRWTLTS